MKVKLTILGISVLVSVGAMAAETGLGPLPIFTTVLTGDYAVAGSNSRVANPVSGVSQTDPFVIGMGGVSAGGTVVKAYANWSFLSSATPGTDTITINGTAVTGVLSGMADPDLCWGQSFSVSYTADVTGLVTGNGAYSIGGATDKFGWLGEGVSLLAVYADPTMALHQVNVYSGMTTTQSGGGVATYDFGAGPYMGGPAHFFINALDGQTNFDDEFFINGSVASGFPGTMGPGNAWQGLVGIAAINNLYDQADGDASSFMLAGDTGLTAGTVSLGDCIGHTFGAISFGAVPEPSSILGLSIGALALLRRRKKS